MDNHMITNLTGSDGYFTFNFFCESIVSSLREFDTCKRKKVPRSQ